MCPEPVCGLFQGLLNRFKDILIQSLVPNCAVVTLDIGVLLGLSGWMYWMWMPIRSAHAMSLPLMYSGP